MTKTTRAPRICELAADEGYNLAGAPVLLARLTAYIGRATFAQLAAIATQAGGEYSRHNQAFQFPIDKPEARETFAQQARVILTNPQPAPDAPATATAARAQSHRAARAAQAAAEARHWHSAEYGNPQPGNGSRTPRPAIARALATFGEGPNQVYTDTQTDEPPAPLVISYGRTIISTVTDRTPAGYGPSPAPDAPAPSRPPIQPALF